MTITPICDATCPHCLQPTGRFLPGVSGEAWVYAYRCDDCALVWKSDRRTGRHGSNTAGGTADVVSWGTVTRSHESRNAANAPSARLRTSSTLRLVERK
jgi:hypothetical protein